jgi:hypothetical protein
VGCQSIFKKRLRRWRKGRTQTSGKDNRSILQSSVVQLKPLWTGWPWWRWNSLFISSRKWKQGLSLQIWWRNEDFASFVNKLNKYYPCRSSTVKPSILCFSFIRYYLILWHSFRHVYLDSSTSTNRKLDPTLPSTVFFFLTTNTPWISAHSPGSVCSRWRNQKVSFHRRLGKTYILVQSRPQP